MRDYRAIIIIGAAAFLLLCSSSVFPMFKSPALGSPQAQEHSDVSSHAGLLGGGASVAVQESVGGSRQSLQSQFSRPRPSHTIQHSLLQNSPVLPVGIEPSQAIGGYRGLTTESQQATTEDDNPWIIRPVSTDDSPSLSTSTPDFSHRRRESRRSSMHRESGARGLDSPEPETHRLHPHIRFYDYSYPASGLFVFQEPATIFCDRCGATIRVWMNRGSHAERACQRCGGEYSLHMDWHGSVSVSSLRSRDNARPDMMPAEILRMMEQVRGLSLQVQETVQRTARVAGDVFVLRAGQMIPLTGTGHVHFDGSGFDGSGFDGSGNDWHSRVWCVFLRDVIGGDEAAL